jgi:hypothetical protein
MTPKEQRAYELRLAGKSFKEIAVELKYADPSGAYQAYQRARDVISIENTGEWRLLELERLNKVQNAVWEQAMQGHIPSINVLIKVFELRAKILGLNAPEKVQVQQSTESSQDLNSAIAEMSEMLKYGLLYCEENGIENDYTRRKHNQ